jgi:hypothetical protein
VRIRKDTAVTILHGPARRTAAVIATVALVIQPALPVLTAANSASSAAQATAKPATPATTAKPATTTATQARPASATSAAAAPIDGGWPRSYAIANGGSLVVYQPQASSWERQAHLVAFSAVTYRSSSKATPVHGTVKLEAATSVSTTERVVRFKDMKIAEINFPTIPKEQLRTISDTIDAAIPDDDRIIALDRVLANIDKSSIAPKNVEGIKADPPVIFFSKTPAVIVVLDGEPIWSPIRENDLKFAVNTNWDLFQHEQTKTFYLRHNDAWLKATTLTGPWTAAGTLPESFKKLPAEDNWKEVKAALPGRKLSATAVPKVFVSTTPAELILLTGEPTYVAVAGTALMWVSNTESDVFRMGRTGLVYYLVAGRWFSSPDFGGPWTFASLNMPPEFQKIPLEHERSRVLASVPGTDQAAEAVLLAQIPQVARVNKKDIKAPDVAYQGDPQFAAIDPLTVQRAVNTDKDIFKVGDAYYMCYQGVWFVGKTAAGPWEVAETVPQVIYQIPASSPSHHVTYVTIEEDDDDDWVVFAAAAGYTGMMIAWGCAVWGTGWYYPPYYGYGGFYPYYYPHFPTYGYSAWYNPYTGAYGRSAAVYGPYGGAGVAARYNPRTGTYARGATAYGPYGSRSVAQAYNPRTGTYAQTRQGSNVYGSWGSTSVQRGDDWVQTNRYTNRQTGTTTRTVRSDEGNAVMRSGDRGTVAAGSGGNIYAGNDGNVYRRQDGTWQKYENGGWNNTPNQPTGDRAGNLQAGDRVTTSQQGAGNRQPQDLTNRTGTASQTNRTTSPSTSSTSRSTMDQLNRDSRARTEGTQRTRDYGTYRSSGTSRSAGSYRGGGGARAGGGGARRR